jgi:hypothetical protein
MAKGNVKLDSREIKVCADRVTEGAWRVEFSDDDGGCYVTVFSGPQAEKRAHAYGWALAEGTVQPIPDPRLPTEAASFRATEWPDRRCTPVASRSRATARQCGLLISLRQMALD